MPELPTVSDPTLGCKLNQAGAETVARGPIAGGARFVAHPPAYRRGLWQGLTPTYLRVYTRADGYLTDKLLPTRLLALQDGRLSGGPEPVGAA